MAVDPRDFVLNTDYEMDKIIYFKEGELDLHGDRSFWHNFDFIPLVFGVCSYSSDFSGTMTLPILNMHTPDGYTNISLFADSDSVNISYDQSPTGNRIYYRIYAFAPSNSTSAVGATNTAANTFILNTDYTYCKLYKKGLVESGSGDTIIQHGLGYVPLVLAWGEHWVADDPSEHMVDTSFAQFSVDTTNVTITRGQRKITHYRIYYDEA